MYYQIKFILSLQRPMCITLSNVQDENLKRDLKQKSK
jgi:hypothetical protein